MLEGVQAPSLPQARVAEDSIDAIVFDISVHEFMAKAGEYCQEVSKLSPSLGLCRLPALLHLRMFSLFGQLCRLRDGDNILAKHDMNILSSANSSSKSWFWRLRGLCLQYGLPPPSTWLSFQPTELQIKSMAKAAVLQYWLHHLRAQADSLSSLKYMQTRYMGLTKCHPLFRSCGASPWEAEKATSQARLLSGRYRVESLTGHWVPGNREGLCTLPDCWGTSAAHKGSVECLLLVMSFPVYDQRSID